MLHTLPSFPDVIGMVGVALTLIAYYLLNVNKLASTDISYLLMNAIGSSLVLYSLCFDWNLSAALIEGAWVIISLIGLYRVLKGRSVKQ